MHVETCADELPLVSGLISPSTWEEFAEKPQESMLKPAARSRLIKLLKLKKGRTDGTKFVFCEQE